MRQLRSKKKPSLLNGKHRHSKEKAMHLNKDRNPYFFNLPQQNKYFDRECEQETNDEYDINDDDNNNKNIIPYKIRGILTCIGSILIYLSLGSIYTIGNMIPYFSSYMTSINNDNYSYLQYISKCNYIFACTVAGQSIFFPIGGKLGQKFGIKITIIIGSIIQSIFGVLCTYFVCHNYLLTYITYGILFGIGIGIAYPNILVLVMRWYPNNKGFVNGLVLCGFGISALIFDKVQTVLINPNNLEQDAVFGFVNDEIIRNFPYIFLYLGAIFFVMQIIGVLLMSYPPTTITTTRMNHNYNYNNNNNHNIDLSERIPLISMNTNNVNGIVNELENGLIIDNDDDDNDIINEISEEIGYDLIDVLKDIRFWQLYFNFFIDGLIIVFITTQWKIFSNNIGVKNDSYLSLIGSISGIFNGGGRILFGFILDKNQSFRFTLGIINILLSILLFTWPYCFGDIMPFIWVCLLFGLFSSNFSIFPTIISFIYGQKNIGIYVGLIFSSQIFSAFIGIYIVDELNNIINNWQYMCFIIAVIQLFGAAISFTFNQKRKRIDNYK